MELHYIILRTYGKDKAEFAFDYFNKFVVDIDDETIKEASEFRLIHKKADLSYVDCIGYVIARKLSIRFLTGDKEFEHLDNVEFVK